MWKYYAWFLDAFQILLPRIKWEWCSGADENHYNKEDDRTTHN
jgi:hypothetical protein